jgi:hypothetical protein
MDRTPRDTNIFSTLLSIIIIVPIGIAAFVLISPWIFYQVAIKAPIDLWRKRKFLKRNNGKVILCITTSARYRNWLASYADDLRQLGINEVVVFNSEITTNQYDNYEWDSLIGRSNGFPILLQFHLKGIDQIPLKVAFQSFFKNEIDGTQLLEFIKSRMHSTLK